MLIPFRPEHLDLLSIQEVLPEPIVCALAEAYSVSLAFTAVMGDMVIGAAGLIPLWKGVAHAWLIPGPAMGHHVGWAIKEIRHMLADAPFKRIQTLCRDDRPHHKRLIELLGFDYEGTMRHYGPNEETYQMFARIK